MPEGERRYSASDAYTGPDRRAASGLDFSHLPTWLKALSVVGFPAFVALYFMAQHAGYVPSPSARVEPLMVSHNEQVNVRLEALSAKLDVAVAEARLNRRILSQVCRNTAKTEYQAVACD